MTKANVLKKYFKKFYDLDLTGMTATQVIKEFYKEKFNFDSKANSFVSAILEAIENDLGPEGGGSGKKTMTIECEYDNDAIILNMAWQDINNAFMDDYEIIINGEYSGQVEKVVNVHYTPSSGKQPAIYVVNTLVGESIGNTYTSSSDTGKPYAIREV